MSYITSPCVKETLSKQCVAHEAHPDGTVAVFRSLVLLSNGEKRTITQRYLYTQRDIRNGIELPNPIEQVTGQKR